MEIETQKPNKPLPLFGVLSILVPIAGTVYLLSVHNHAGTMDYMDNDTKRVHILWMTSAFGLASIVAAWIRQERFPALRWIGIAVCLPYLILALVSIALLIVLTSSSDWHM